jgi:SAM-dependent methyltransferase
MRKTNNNEKRNFLTKYVTKGSNVLDVGCGQGGDLHKWKHLECTIVGVDPNHLAIEEAISRSKSILPSAKFTVGSILDSENVEFDCVCYNFSMQYESPDNYTEIKKRLKVGGNLIGIIPDPTRLDYALEHGIHVSHVSDKELSVWIPDTPYYTNGPVSEPLVHSKDLIEKLEDIGFKCVLYGDSFSMYSKFVFKLVSK